MPQSQENNNLKAFPLNSREDGKKPSAGYPTETLTSGKKCFPRSKKKGDRGFIEGCLFALCCCWICDMCF